MTPEPVRVSPHPPCPPEKEAIGEAPPEARHAPVVTLSSVLDDLDQFVAGASGRSMTLAELEEALRGRGTALLILVLSLPFIIPVVIPLLSTVCGVPMIALGVTIAVRGRGSFPAFARRRVLSPEALAAIGKGLRKVLKPIAWAFRPRLGILFWALPWRLTGVSIALAAFVLSLPLPIPFANMIPALGLIHLAAGMIQRDGVAICVGHGFTLAAYLYLYLIWDTAWAVLSGLLGSPSS